MNDPINLRPVQSDDLVAFFAHQCDPIARRMVAFCSAESSDWTAFEAKWRGLLAGDDAMVRTIEVDDLPAGYVTRFMQFGLPSIGYWLGRSFWGRGIAKNAVGQFVAMIAVRPLYARVASDNLASLRVLAHAGFQQVGTDRDVGPARGEEVDEIILALGIPGSAGGRNR